jgi:hypothetical protein
MISRWVTRVKPPHRHLVAGVCGGRRASLMPAGAARSSWEGLVLLTRQRDDLALRELWGTPLAPYGIRRFWPLFGLSWRGVRVVLAQVSYRPPRSDACPKRC